MENVTVFISGHLSLTEEEFNIYYRPEIDLAIISGFTFVVGDAPGADYMAQLYLKDRVESWRVKVFHAYSKPRNCLFNSEGNYSNQTQKDKAMTLASDYDIAWVRPGKENSGTARNLARRLALKK